MVYGFSESLERACTRALLEGSRRSPPPQATCLSLSLSLCVSLSLSLYIYIYIYIYIGIILIIIINTCHLPQEADEVPHDAPRARLGRPAVPQGLRDGDV